MMILTAAKVAGAALVGTLAIGSGRNMVQTYAVASNKAVCDPAATPLQGTTTTVSALESLSRKQLLKLYLNSDAPSDLKQLDGQWNGVLLKNNRFFMTRVTNFITNQLFGKRRTWNGKLFDSDRGQGSNRFDAFSQEHCKKIKDKVTVILATETDRSFDISIQSSCWQPSKECVTLVYAPHNKRTLWSSMKDEIRLVPGSNGDIWIGMGSMAWSGGTLNASPFLLYRNRKL